MPRLKRTSMLRSPECGWPAGWRRPGQWHCTVPPRPGRSLRIARTGWPRRVRTGCRQSPCQRARGGQFRGRRCDGRRRQSWVNPVSLRYRLQLCRQRFVGGLLKGWRQYKCESLAFAITIAKIPFRATGYLGNWRGRPAYLSSSNPRGTCSRVATPHSAIAISSSSRSRRSTCATPCAPPAASA